MDWSIDIPEAPISLSLYVSPTSEHVLLPYNPLHNTGSNGKNRAKSATSSLLDYGEG